MTCPSSVPSGVCWWVVLVFQAWFYREGIHFLVIVVFQIEEWPHRKAACTCLLTPNRAWIKSSLLNTCANMHISVTSVQSDKPVCHQAQASWQFCWSQVDEKSKLRVADWHLGAVMMLGGPSQVPVVCRRANICLMKPLSPPPMRHHSITAERWATWKWAASSRISKSPVAMWWQQSSEQEPAQQHEGKMNNL